jgi:hypothetical protein
MVLFIGFVCHLPVNAFLLGLFFYPEDGDWIFLQNASGLLFGLHSLSYNSTAPFKIYFSRFLQGTGALPRKPA